MLNRLLAGALVALTLVGSPGTGFFVTDASASTSPRGSASVAANWLKRQQSGDGAMPHPQARVDEVAEAAASVAATGAWPEAVAGALNLIARRGPSEATRGGQAGRLVAGIVGAGGDPRRLGGHDFVSHLQRFYDPATGRYDAQVYAHALAMIGVASSGGTVPPEAVRYLQINQCADGGFSHEPGCLRPADTDTTSIAISALVASRSEGTAAVLEKARQWLASAQNNEGGFGDRPGAPTNSNSTGLALSAIAALGERPIDDAWVASGGWAVEELMQLQNADGGFPHVSGGKADGYATVQAIPGLLGLAHPLAPPAAREAGSGEGRIGAGSKSDARTGADQHSDVGEDGGTVSSPAQGETTGQETAADSADADGSPQGLKTTSGSTRRDGASLLGLVALAGLLSVLVASGLVRRGMLRRGLAGSDGSALRSEQV